MKPKEVIKLVNYWKKTAQHDYETMLGLFRIKRYPDCLFFGHIVLEKILKAHVVKHTKTLAPFTHDLIRLEKNTELRLQEEELDLLDLVNAFNIRARYPEYKLQFYKKCTKPYTEKYLKRISTLYKDLCQKLK